MPDVFLSYAHEDEAIVERLRAALTARDREVWLDRSIELGEGIIPASDWNASALDGIDDYRKKVTALAHQLAHVGEPMWLDASGPDPRERHSSSSCRSEAGCL